MAKRILLVVDDPSIVIGLRMNLEREGYEIELAEDGDAALGRIRDHGFDLVLLDVMLPKRNGYEVLEAMRKEAIQVAAMAMRFAIEVCNEERGRK